MTNSDKLLHWCCHCCSSAVDQEAATELQTVPGIGFDTPPRWPEPIYCPAFEPRHPLIDIVEVSVGIHKYYTDSFTSSSFDKPPSSPEMNTLADISRFRSDGSASPPLRCYLPSSRPIQTQRYRKSIEILHEFQKTYELIDEAFKGIHIYSACWLSLLLLQRDAKDFLGRGSDKLFYYGDRSGVATDANLPEIKTIADELQGEWEDIRALLLEEGTLVQQVSEKE